MTNEERDARIAEIRARVDALPTQRRTLDITVIGLGVTEADFLIAAHAGDDLPWLLAEVSRLDGLVAARTTERDEMVTQMEAQSKQVRFLQNRIHQIDNTIVVAIGRCHEAAATFADRTNTREKWESAAAQLQNLRDDLGFDPSPASEP